MMLLLSSRAEFDCPWKLGSRRHWKQGIPLYVPPPPPFPPTILLLLPIVSVSTLCLPKGFIETGVATCVT